MIAANLGAVIVGKYGDLLWPRAFYLSPIWTALPALAGAGLRSPDEAPSGRRPGGPADGDPTRSAFGRGSFEERRRCRIRRSESSRPGRSTGPRCSALARDGITRLYEEHHARRDLASRVPGARDPLALLRGGAAAVRARRRRRRPGHPRLVGRRPLPLLAQSLAALGATFEYRPYPPLGGAYARFAVRPAAPPRAGPRHSSARRRQRAPPAPPDPRPRRRHRVAHRRPHARRRWNSVLDLGAVHPGRPGALAPARLRGNAGRARPGGVPRPRRLAPPSSTSPAYQGAALLVRRPPPGPRPERPRRAPRPPGRPRATCASSRPAPARAGPRSISELFVYALDPAGPAALRPLARAGPTSPPRSLAPGVQRLYADHGWGSAPRSPIPTSGSSPRISTSIPTAGTARAPSSRPPSCGSPGAGALVEPVDAEEASRGSPPPPACPVRRDALGDLVLFQATPAPPLAGRPLPAAALTLTASLHPETTALAPSTASARPAGPPAGPRPRATGSASTSAPPCPSAPSASGPSPPRRAARPRPRGLSSTASAWHPLAARISTEGELRWGGIALLRSGVEAVRLRLSPHPSAPSRVTLTRGDPVFDWSVHELTLFAE